MSELLAEAGQGLKVQMEGTKDTVVGTRQVLPGQQSGGGPPALTQTSPEVVHASAHANTQQPRTGVSSSVGTSFSLVGAALAFYGRKRTHDGQGLTISSQRRFVSYYARMLDAPGETLTPQAMRLLALRVCGAPAWLVEAKPGCTLGVWVRPTGQHEPRLLAVAHLPEPKPPSHTTETSANTKSDHKAGRHDTQHNSHTFGCFGGSKGGASSVQVAEEADVDQRAVSQTQTLHPPLPCSIQAKLLPDGSASFEFSSTDRHAGRETPGGQNQGVVVEGDIKVQIFKGRILPRSAAVFNGSASQMLTWVSTGMLEEHQAHVCHSVRPGVPLAQTAEPTGQAATGSKWSDRSSVKRLSVVGAELDKVHKKLRRSCWHELRLTVEYERA